MRALGIWCLVVVAILLGQPAAATSDGGLGASLLAVAGPGQRYAIVQHVGVQQGCYDGCQTFVLDTHATTFKRLHVATVKQDGDMIAAYLQTLPKAMRAKLEPVSRTTGRSFE